MGCCIAAVSGKFEAKRYTLFDRALHREEQLSAPPFHESVASEHILREVLCTLRDDGIEQYDTRAAFQLEIKMLSAFLYHVHHERVKRTIFPRTISRSSISQVGVRTQRHDVRDGYARSVVGTVRDTYEGQVKSIDQHLSHPSPYCYTHARVCFCNFRVTT